MTPTHAAALQVASESFAMLTAALDGVPDEAAGWMPAPATNPLAVLVTHSVTSARFWLGAGAGKTGSMRSYQQNERSASFSVHGDRIADLVALVRRFQPELEAILSEGTATSLEATVSFDTDSLARSGVECLFHGLAHLREHTGQAQLMRDLWLAAHPLPDAPR